ncbi:MAG: BamA/TamA family outer membrane protein [Bacteroidales bacterium]|nr:BamA/TamA family outer membrane protein [Bacteroidales bacterium]
MGKKSLIWKIPCITLGSILGVVLLLCLTLTVILVTPALRTAVLREAVEQVNARTDWDVDLGGLYLSPFHQSPLLLYRAFKGEEELPLQIEIDSLFAGHRGQDTLVYVRRLRLMGTLRKVGEGEPKGLPARSIDVDTLLLERTTFHSDTLIPAVGVNVIVGTLQVKSPGLNIAQGKYPLHALKLSDTYVGIDLREAPTEPKDTAVAPLPMAFEVPDGALRNIRFVLNPVGLDLRVGSLSTNVLADVGGNRYDARSLCLENTSLSIASLTLPFDAVEGDALVDLNTQLIASNGLYARSDSLGAEAQLKATQLDLETMRVDVVGDADFRGSKAALNGYYDIDDERYDMRVNVEKVDISSFLEGEHHAEIAGTVHAQGKGLDPHSPEMKSEVSLQLSDCIYDGIDASGLKLDATLADKTVDGTLHLPFAMNQNELSVKANTEHQFSVSDFLTPEKMRVDYHTQMKKVSAHVAGEDFKADRLNLDFATDTATALRLKTQGLSVDAKSPMHVLTLVDKVQPLLRAVSDSNFVHDITSLKDLTKLDTLRRLIPALQADINVSKGSPVQALIERNGLDIKEVDLSLQSDDRRSDLSLDASIPEILHPEDSTALRLPAAAASLRVGMTEGMTRASLTAHTAPTDGWMNVHNLSTDAALEMDLERSGRALSGTGQLVLDSLRYNDMKLGNRRVDFSLAPSGQYANSVRADVSLDDIPLELVGDIVRMDDIELGGRVRARAGADGLPGKMDLSAEVLPMEVSARYKPYDIKLRLGQTPILMEHNQVKLNNLPIYAADSSCLVLNGGMDLATMRLDVGLSADRFSPARLEQGGPIPVYGTLETDIRGRVSGPMDAILADVDVTILPTTDITYPIDQKNLAQVSPHGTVKVRYDTAGGGLNLGGKIDVDKGQVRYSPKLYPMMPFQVDSASNIAFNGPLGQTRLDISASQQVKADVQSEDEETRRVLFNTGVRIDGVLDSLDLKSLGFFLEAPEDETITRELASMDQDTREGIAATLLATGMYVGESNVAAQKSGYALSSIVNSRLNAAMANSKMGKVIEVDISSGQTEHASGKTNDMNIAISKTLFDGKLRITAGSTISDNPEVNKTNGLLSRVSADYRLTPSGDVFLRLFSQRDYDNIFEGELTKSGIGVGVTKQWKQRRFLPSRGDTITRSYNFTADANIAYRSNNSIGPNLTLSQSIKNLLGSEEILALKGHGAYYWALRDRYPGDPKKTDTYKIGLDASLTFPYLHWAGDDNPEGDTRYRLGYKYENIAGGCSVHKFSGSFSYFIRPSRYITHVFTPFSLSFVGTKLDVTDWNNTSRFPEMIKMLAGNEFVPSIGYEITYNDYRTRRAVNTMVEVEVKEAGNLLNAVYCAFGHKWNEKNKTLFNLPFNQFVRLTAELWNKFNLTEQVCIATRLFAGANVPLGNAEVTPLSEAFYAGGPNSLRAAEPYAYGPGNFHSFQFNQNFFHAGDVKLEANFELRFPIVWKLYGAAFLDAGNVWNWYNLSDVLSREDYEYFIRNLGMTVDLKDGIVGNPEAARQIALGTGAGLRLDIDGLVIRLDLGIAIHAPYQTYKYDKEGKPDLSQPITTYYNIPSGWDGLRLNFGIGYPF